MEKITEIQNALVRKAFKSKKTLGRKSQDDPDLFFSKVLDPFEVDIWKIKMSKSFRALAGKTQVWPVAENPLVRNRLTHTLEVESIANLIARVLGLNDKLTSAIALAHDLGHAPFGHMFERVISRITSAEFRHEIFGPILLQQIERQGQGLNLSLEVLEGITRHSRGGGNLTIEEGFPLEYDVVMYADKLAYLFSDINDATRQDYIQPIDLPASLKFLGKNQRAQINSCLMALFQESVECGYVSFSKSPEALAFEKTRQWMYDHVYYKLDTDTCRLVHEQDIENAFSFIRNYFCLERIDAAVILATMTDREVLVLSALKHDARILDVHNLGRMGFMERMEYCKDVGFGKEDIDFSWAGK